MHVSHAGVQLEARGVIHYLDGEEQAMLHLSPLEAALGQMGRLANKVAPVVSTASRWRPAERSPLAQPALERLERWGQTALDDPLNSVETVGEPETTIDSPPKAPGRSAPEGKTACCVVM
jgi:hypothetical protein